MCIRDSNYLAFDKKSKVACETLVTTGQVVVAGEIKTNSIIDYDKIIRRSSLIMATRKGAACEAIGHISQSFRRYSKWYQ